MMRADYDTKDLSLLKVCAQRFHRPPHLVVTEGDGCLFVSPGTIHAVINAVDGGFLGSYVSVEKTFKGWRGAMGNWSREVSVWRMGVK